MLDEVRKTLVLGTVAAAVVSAALLASSEGGMPRVAGMVDEAVRVRPMPAQRTEAPGPETSASVVPAGPRH